MYFQLLYISSASRQMLRIDVEQILFTARRTNDKNGVTGLLVASPARFMQVLEGDETVVRETYARICADPRNRAHVILRETEVAERQFGDWTMASQFLPDAAFGNMADQVRSAVADCDVITTAYLLGFAEQRAAA
jgi:Sensors of blue-light using FAD